MAIDPEAEFRLELEVFGNEVEEAILELLRRADHT